MTKLLVLVVAVGCSKGDDKKPVAVDPQPAAPAAGDPWAAGAAGAAGPSGSDPWQATAGPSAASDPERPASPDEHAAPSRPPPPPTTGAASTLAGTYDCSMLSSGSSSGRYQTDYVPSAMGTFQIGENGGYSSASYPDKGSGQIHADGRTVTFDGGPYAGFIGLVGSVSSGATIRFGGVQTQPPTPSVHFKDHVCYRK